VDTLRFSSTVVTAVQHGAVIYPCAWEDDAEEIARRAGGSVADRRRNRREQGRFSLSPLTYLAVKPGTRVVLPSPNGATCSRYGRDVDHLFVGALLNARAVGETVATLLEATEQDVTVIACGERWELPTEDGVLRFAIEDYLGAGAILSHLPHPHSPEAHLCAGSFRHALPDLTTLLWECGSGRELREKGLGEDVVHASQLDLYDAIPVMRGEWLERHSP
jgi:2-phosphosulfolactate phosphatase